jgi:hypothetical protein
MFRWLLTLGLMVAATAAMADENTTVNLAPFWSSLLEYLVPVIGVLITALVAWAATLFQRLTGVNIDAKHRAALQSALETGVNYGLAKAGDKAKNLTVDVRSAIVADAITWVEKSVPDAVKHFGITPETVAEMAAAKLQVADPNAPSIPAAPAPASNVSHV